MGTFTKGDIVLFAFPYTDLQSRKLRPCLVLSEPIHEDILLAQITSRKVDTYSIKIALEETINGSLSRESYARANMLFTASTAQIHKKMCSLKKEKYKEIVKTITQLIE